MSDTPAINRSRFPKRTIKIYRLLEKWFYVHFRKVLPWQISYAQSHYVLGEERPFWLLKECGSDLRTALHRVGQRIDELPFYWSRPVGPCFEQAPNKSWVPNIRTHGCMKDMQRFETQFPMATAFDWEMFRIGWEEGDKWGEDHQRKIKREENTFNPPEFNSISEEEKGGEL